MNFEMGHLNNIHLRDPFYHLALEEYMLSRLEENQIVFWIWQSPPSVILGKNQVLWKEVNLPYAREHHIRIARRISGGGTVYHDEGNVNYTIIVPKPLYRESDLLQLTARSLHQIGLNARIKNKNALFIGHRKIGGTAFRIGKTHVLHHGTILLNANLRVMQHVLQSSVPCETKGVASRPSPVMNCIEINPQLNIQQIENSLLKSLQSYFQAPVNSLVPPDPMNNSDFEKIYKKLKSFEWIVGESPPVLLFLDEENNGKQYMIRLKVEKGIITEVQIQSDHGIGSFSAFQSAVRGTPLIKKHLKAVLKKFHGSPQDFLYKRIMDMAM